MVAIRSTDFMPASFVLAFINFVPLIFLTFLYRNRESLGATKYIESIGQLYIGKNPNRSEHYIHLVPTAFLYRRTIFSTATVFLYEQPNLQIIINNSLSILMIVLMAVDDDLF